MARSFYEDEEHLTPIPGTTETPSQQELDSLSPKLINGTSIRSPSLLESKISSIRTTFNSFFNQTESKIDELTNKYHAKEQHFSSTISNLHDKNEDLLPAGIYITIASLTGSILTRRSNIAFRATIPLLLGTLAFKLTLPNTFNNSSSFLYKIESENLPQLTNKQNQLIKELQQLQSKSIKNLDNGVVSIDDSLTNLKQGIKKYGGLNTDDVVTKK